MNTKNTNNSRRDFLRKGLQFGILAGLGVVSIGVVKKVVAEKTVWQLDPNKCTQCGRCASSCIKTPSAVKCFHVYDMCGYCDLCGGFFKPGVKDLTTAAENQLCPTAALKRNFVEEPFFEYHIDKKLCIGCGKCVKGCGAFGNGSLQLQIDESLCDNCNECAIARDCPSDAFKRVPASYSYLLLGLKEKDVWKNKS